MPSCLGCKKSEPAEPGHLPALPLGPGVSPAGLFRDDAANPHHRAHPDALRQRHLVGHVLQVQRRGVRSPREPGARTRDTRGSAPGRKHPGPRSAESVRRKGPETKEREPEPDKERESQPRGINREGENPERQMGAWGWVGSTREPQPRPLVAHPGTHFVLPGGTPQPGPAPPRVRCRLGSKPPGPRRPPKALTELPAMAGTLGRQAWWWVWLLGP